MVRLAVEKSVESSVNRMERVGEMEIKGGLGSIQFNVNLVGT